MGSDSFSAMDSTLKSSTLPWKEMFRSASFRMPNSDPFTAIQTDVSADHNMQRRESAADDQSASSLTPEITGGFRSFSMSHIPDRTVEVNSKSVTVPWQVMFRSASFRRPDLSTQNQNPSTENTNISSPNKFAQCSKETSEEGNLPSTSETSETQKHGSRLFPSEAQLWLAIYVTLTQAVLALAIFLLYGFFKLLEEYIRPIIWAGVCSIPLRGIQDSLVEFWSVPLRSGLTDTILAVPVAVVRASAGSIIDARDVFSWVFYGETLENLRPEKNGFLRLVRRLVSFGFFVFAYETIGKFGAFTLIGVGFMFSSNLSPSTISAVSSLRSDSFRLRSNTSSPEDSPHKLHLDKISRAVSQGMLSRLKTVLAIGLISGMIIGSLAGVIFISYQIGAEGKDAVLSIKSYLEESNYAENIGIKRWINKNNPIELMDWYASECYETLLQQIDNVAYQYNISELVEVFKQLVITPYAGLNFTKNATVCLDTEAKETKYIFRLRNLIEQPVLDKAKCFATQGMDLSLRLLASSKFILDGSVHFLLYVGQSIFFGAAGFMQFLIHLTIFFWVLYYLLTSESGGVTHQIMKVLPVRRSIKKRCIEALENAISGVLLVTAEIAFFHGCFTWLLCRLFSIHFAYMSTMLAFISPLLPIFPPWLPALPGLVQLMIDGRYALAICFCMTHIVVTDYGASEIAQCVPGYSTYLTGVSIIGGMTLFPSALEVILLSQFAFKQ